MRIRDDLGGSGFFRLGVQLGRTSNSERGDRGEDAVDFLDAIGVVAVALWTSICTGVDTVVVGGLLRLGDLEVSDELLVTDLVTEGHPRKAVGSGVLTSGVATGRSGAWVATGRSGAGVATGRSGAGFVTSPLGSNKKKKKTGNYPSLYKRTSEHHYICSDSCGITMATAAMMN